MKEHSNFSFSEFVNIIGKISLIILLTYAIIKIFSPTPVPLKCNKLENYLNINAPLGSDAIIYQSIQSEGLIKDTTVSNIDSLLKSH